MKNATRHLLQRVTVVVSLVWAFSCPLVYAGDRNCSVEERLAADKWLFLNARDRKAALAKHLPFGMPASKDVSNEETTLVSWEFVIQYDKALRVPRWIAYQLVARGIGKLPDRVNCFRQDPRVNAPNASLPSDYDEPLFDQGHLAPSEDMSQTLNRNVNSFIMSNMSPQYGNFNRVIWNRLEGQVRVWVKSRKVLDVITGSIFDDDDDGKPDAPSDIKRMKSKSGKKRVAIPSHFFKILVHPCKDGSTEAIAFLLPHNTKSYTGDAGKKYLEEQVTSISKIEALTDVQFFPDQTEIDRSKVQEYWSTKSACDG